MIITEECVDSSAWDNSVHDLMGHPLQLWGWGELKSAHNWQARRIHFYDENHSVIGAAQILIRKLPIPFNQFCYVPRGPIWKPGHDREVLEALQAYCKKELPGTHISIEPDAKNIDYRTGWRTTNNTILIPRTLILDLRKSEEDLLSAASKKTRQYIRKSKREGLEIVRVTTKDDLAALLAIYKETAQRAGFALHDDQYYFDVHDKLGESSVIFAAMQAKSPIAFVWLAASSKTAFELYGGMNETGQSLRANYALKWHAISRCKEWGIERYDMNGLLNDGVSNFKRGFADHEDMLIGTLDFPMSPLYPVWSTILPGAKKIIRKIKSLR